MKKTVLFILEYFKPHIGGSETLFEHVISGLLSAGYQVIVLTSRYDPKLAEREQMFFGEHSIDVWRVGHDRYDFMRYGLRKVRSLCQQYQIDLIQTATFNAAFVAGVWRIFNRIPTVLHVHEIYVQLWYTFFGRKGFFYKLFESLIFQFKFDHYTCSSLYTKNSLRSYIGIPDHKLTTTYCGIDYELRDPQCVDRQQCTELRKQYGLETAYVGLYFGRPGVAKGLIDYLHAIPYIVDQIPHFKAFLIVPKTEKSTVGVIKSTISNDEVTQLIVDLHLQDAVVWIDSVLHRDLKTFVMMADVIVLPTMVEGFGLAIAEVCALGRPLVTTNVGSVPEVVCGNEIQFVEPGNPKDIARGVIDLFHGKTLLIPEKRFLWKDCVDRFISVYERFL